MNITTAVDARRMHHQLYPMEISFENKFLSDMDVSIKLIKIIFIINLLIEVSDK